MLRRCTKNLVLNFSALHRLQSHTPHSCFWLIISMLRRNSSSLWRLLIPIRIARYWLPKLHLKYHVPGACKAM
ncbi:unnamed protein product [Linum tenue]|uniref:Uncharacterized protein n=1 Tax=Linum tenue TaxID=586396 RepID=A0AAV0LAJ4_9ROSI|nr:unnamed protein product [Linum tenue]